MSAATKKQITIPRGLLAMPLRSWSRVKVIQPNAHGEVVLCCAVLSTVPPVAPSPQPLNQPIQTDPRPYDMIPYHNIPPAETASALKFVASVFCSATADGSW